MNDTNRKVVLLKGDSTKWYEQAIFIMRSGASESEIDFVLEAEKIINSQGLHNSISKKYDAHNFFTTAPATTLPAPAPSPAAKQKESAKTQAKNANLDFKLNLGLLFIGLLIAAVIVYNIL